MRDVPDSLSTAPDWEAPWRDPGLLLSQCCGYDAVMPPYRSQLRIVATPRYRAPGCVGGRYSSLVMVRQGSALARLEDLCGARAVINNPTSHSGWNALRALVLPYRREGRFFASVAESGCHLESLRWLQRGWADVAAIDCVVIELVRRHQPGLLRGLRTLAFTPLAAAPPYVTRAALPASSVEVLRRALRDVMADPALALVREALLLDGVEVLPRGAYRSMVEQDRRARHCGYRDLRPTTCAAVDNGVLI
jgi:ABC-type phosphate/phosphonate transport system substrate-binding protein